MNRAYTGVLFRPYKKYSDEVISKVASAYHEWRIAYICKTTIQNGEELYPNVCTEIRQKHLGQCVLGAINLSKMSGLSFPGFVNVFRESSLTMLSQLEISKSNNESNPDLFGFERQVGLGFVGMANLLGDLGCTYQDAVQWFSDNLAIDWGSEELTFTELMEEVLKTNNQQTPASKFWTMFIGGIIAGTIAVGDKLDRLWTSQPTAHTSLRLGEQIEETALLNLIESGYKQSCKPITTNAQAAKYITDNELPIVIKKIGKAVAPELQPPYAARLPGKQGSRVINQSQLKGSTELIYSYKVQVRDEVPEEVYYNFCCQIQRIFDFTQKAHTLSHCVWEDVITTDLVKRFLDGPLQSMYYRLDPSPASTMDKSTTWDDDGLDLSILFTQEVCEVCSM